MGRLLLLGPIPESAVFVRGCRKSTWGGGKKRLCAATFDAALEPGDKVT
jgi:hypothetical protein